MNSYTIKFGINLLHGEYPVAPVVVDSVLRKNKVSYIILNDILSNTGFTQSQSDGVLDMSSFASIPVIGSILTIVFE